MEEDTPAGNKPGGSDAAEREARREEAKAVLAAGPGSGNRSAALAFLALLVVIAAALHFHFTGGGSAGYINRLDAELINHAELSVASMEDQNRMAVVPSWPLDLYETLRKNIAVYAALAALAAYVWSLASRARARRDAFIVHDKLNAELDELRQRLERLENTGPPRDSTTDMKG